MSRPASVGVAAAVNGKSRRSFLRAVFVWLGSMLSGLFPRWTKRARSAPLESDGLNEELLHAVARTVLPSELDDAARACAVDAFLGWLRGYRAGAVLDHGYGFTEIRRAPENPARGYQGDLTELTSRAEAEFGASFGSLDARQKRTLIEAAIGARHPGTSELAARPGDSHVAVALVTHYFRSTDANDRCYRREIGARTCRDLFRAVDEPPPLDDA